MLPFTLADIQNATITTQDMEAARLANRKTLSDIIAREKESRYNDSLLSLKQQEFEQNKKLMPLEQQIRQGELDYKNAALGVQREQLQGQSAKNQQEMMEPVIATARASAMWALKNQGNEQQTFETTLDNVSAQFTPPQQEYLQKIKGIGRDRNALMAFVGGMDAEQLGSTSQVLEATKDGGFNTAGLSAGQNSERLGAPIILTGKDGKKIAWQPTNMRGNQPQVTPLPEGLTLPEKSKAQPKIKFDRYVRNKQNPQLFDHVASYDDGSTVVLEEGVLHPDYESKTQSGMAESNQKIADKLQEENISLENQKMGLQKVKEVVRSSPVVQGAFSDYRLLARQLAEIIPGARSIVDTESVGPSELVNSIMSGLRIDSMSGGSFAGVSNYEQQILKEMLPSLAQSPEGMELTMEFRNDFIERKQALNEHIQDVFSSSQTEGKSINLKKEINSWLKKNPIENYISKATKDKAEAILSGSVSPRSLPMPGNQPTAAPAQSETPSEPGPATETSPGIVVNKVAPNKMYHSGARGVEVSGKDVMATWQDKRIQEKYGTFEEYLRALRLEE